MLNKQCKARLKIRNAEASFPITLLSLDAVPLNQVPNKPDRIEAGDASFTPQVLRLKCVEGNMFFTLDTPIFVGVNYLSIGNTDYCLEVYCERVS